MHGLKSLKSLLLVSTTFCLEAILEQWDDQQSYKHIMPSIAFSQHLVIQVLRMPFDCLCSPINPERRHFHVSFSLNDGTWLVPQVEARLLLPQFAFFSVFGF